MSKSTKQDREDTLIEGAAMSDDDPRAYEPVPGDKGKKTKPSKYTKKFKKMYGEEEMELDEKIAGLVKKSKQTGVPYGTLKKSYDRGMVNVENRTQTWHYSTTMGVCKSELNVIRW